MGKDLKRGKAVSHIDHLQAEIIAKAKVLR